MNGCIINHEQFSLLLFELVNLSKQVKNLHHSGLADCLKADEANGFFERINKDNGKILSAEGNKISIHLFWLGRLSWL